VAAVEVERLARHYGEREALSDVSLSLARGQTLVVLGPNGAGKTTLLRILASLLRPHGGEVRVLERRLPEDSWQLRGQVGLLAHEPMLYRSLSAEENLRFHARLHGVRGDRVASLLGELSLSGRAGEPLRSLSRGMVQRVAIGRAVLHDPELLLLDEPYANLDPAAIELVGPLIGPQSGRTRVLCSHDPAAALREADVVLGLREGRVAVQGTAAEVSAGELEALYR
jgi:heme ABC exporter ATP-binding subunit CcmA